MRKLALYAIIIAFSFLAGIIYHTCTIKPILAEDCILVDVFGITVVYDYSYPSDTDDLSGINWRLTKAENR